MNLQEVRFVDDHTIEIVIDNVAREQLRMTDFTEMPHAIFTESQIGAIGQSEAELDDADQEVVVGRAAFTDTAMFRPLKLDHEFAKVLADPETYGIFSCHALGHRASMFIHEVAPRNPIESGSSSASIQSF